MAVIALRFDKQVRSSSVAEWEISVNPLPNNKILDWSKLKAIADDKMKVLKMVIFVFDMIENIVEKEGNASYQYFLFLPQCFQKAFYSRSLKVRIMW